MRKPLLFALAALALATTLAGAEIPATELFPAEPGINAERGFAVAVAGDWLAMGAHRDDEKQKDAGAVYLFKWSGTTWDQKAKLFAELPRERAHLGFSLAMRNGVLAAGAPGEGAVYLFALQEESEGWVPVQRLTGPSRAFGRSLALDGNRLAVGVVGGHGVTDGAVYLYRHQGDSWSFQQKLQPRTRRAGERFGAAVALAGKVLAVGAPGYGAGAVYVFQPDPVRWKEKAKLPPPDGPPEAGDQLGAAVATDGTEIFAGAPTADPAGLENSGAVYRFVQGAGGWLPQGALAVGDPVSGDQLGASLALSGDLLVAGAPAPPPGTGPGGIRVFRRPDASWERPVPGNTETRDLAGFAAAVDGERVVVGGVLGDQGGGAAGAVWSFRCPEEEECAEEAEAVARDQTADRRYGVAVGLTEGFMAVGAPASGPDDGAVYLYRPARRGWRQERRLTSPDSDFGSAVALGGQRLAVGAPRSRFYPEGAVYLFSREEGFWDFEVVFRQVGTSEKVEFGTSVAVEDDTVAIGAPGGFLPNTFPTVFVEEKLEGGWTRTGKVLHDKLDSRFGSAISLRGGVLAIGAPGAGTFHVLARGAQGWPNLERPVHLNPLAQAAGTSLGASVAVGAGVLAAGAPGSLGGLGAVRLFQQNAGGTWGERRFPAPPFAGVHRLGASSSLLETRLAVGAPDPEGHGRTFLFDLVSEGWEELLPLEPQVDDDFGAAVALSKRFLVVTSPGRGDRVTVFELSVLEGGNQ